MNEDDVFMTMCPEHCKAAKDNFKGMIHVAFQWTYCESTFPSYLFQCCYTISIFAVKFKDTVLSPNPYHFNKTSN